MKINYKKTGILLILFLIFIVSSIIFLVYGLDFSHKNIILAYIRIPSLLNSIIAGASLALAGMILQTISKNPLADPYLTGLSSGAGLGIAISLLLFSGLNYSFFGFLGALTVGFLVISLSGFSKFSITKLILIGLAVNIFTSSIISFLILTNPDKAYAMTLILSGGFSNNELSPKILFSGFVLLLLLVGFMVNKLNLFRLDTKLVFSSDKKLKKYNIILVILSALLTSVSVYTSGILGFIGIIVPLLSIMILGNDFRYLFFGNIFIGSILLIVANILSKYLIYPVQIPLGIVVAFIGAPVFIFFLLKKKGGIFND